MVFQWTSVETKEHLSWTINHILYMMSTCRHELRITISCLQLIIDMTHRFAYKWTLTYYPIKFPAILKELKFSQYIKLLDY